MGFLLDTNIISEPMRPTPNPRVIVWLESQDPRDLFLAAQTVGELVRGAIRARDDVRRRRISRWIEHELSQQFFGRILPFDDATARVWGHLVGVRDRIGRTPSLADSQIASVAIRPGLTVVTRNVRDFAPLDVENVNPWVGV